MSADPPFEVGAVHDKATVAVPLNSDLVTVAANTVGAPGREAVDALLVADAVPVPTMFTAETRNVYVVECDRPVTVVDVVVEVPSANVVHVAPLSDEYSTV